jgi:antitoxin (DNA-binding transcriptional repressor) of toxin-antitoxin stability system
MAAGSAHDLPDLTVTREIGITQRQLCVARIIPHSSAVVLTEETKGTRQNKSEECVTSLIMRIRGENQRREKWDSNENSGNNHSKMQICSLESLRKMNP